MTPSAIGRTSEWILDDIPYSLPREMILCPSCQISGCSPQVSHLDEPSTSAKLKVWTVLTQRIEIWSSIGCNLQGTCGHSVMWIPTFDGEGLQLSVHTIVVLTPMVQWFVGNPLCCINQRNSVGKRLELGRSLLPTKFKTKQAPSEEITPGWISQVGTRHVASLKLC